MNIEEKAKWLSEFYAQVAEGGEMQIRYAEQSDKWTKAVVGPALDANPKCWRLKPKEYWFNVYSQGIFGHGYDSKDKAIKAAGYGVIRTICLVEKNEI